jgi:Flp pilus assembly protein CpaB
VSDTVFTASRQSAGPNGGGRPLRRRKALPGSRAVVGGFLVALAAVGIFAAYTGATGDDRRTFVVARHDLPMGHRITSADLATLPMDLPPALEDRAARDPAQLVGAVVVGPLGKGELVQASDIVTVGETGPQVSFPIESARALDGRLRVGELVDVVATYEGGGEGQTTVVVRNARVVDRSKPGGSLGDGGKEVITLAVGSRADTLAVAHASQAGKVTLVRVTGQQPPGTGDVTTYQSPTGGAAAPSG